MTTSGVFPVSSQGRALRVVSKDANGIPPTIIAVLLVLTKKSGRRLENKWDLIYASLSRSTSVSPNRPVCDELGRRYVYKCITVSNQEKEAMLPNRIECSPKLRPHLKVWLSSDDGTASFGDGRWELLKSVEREGSLMAATEALGISYRKAWGDLKKAEQALGIKLIERRRGGTGGGDTRLTQAGRECVQAYGHFRTRVEKAINEAFGKQFKHAAG